ncbi:DUF58 domain-containing protein [Gimesia fumaroli]|uniref:VWFA domain-containing protein n=1 Tax=Gimesia fumaroli TaxID=2527976 RepID=A0A518IDF5_9PLAN|nr:DUF58 domain-containing protein [Gimesia fumaroli]QDV51099.1 hypothetical protein Enr17x_31510 [Gimesia fumaroli]
MSQGTQSNQFTSLFDNRTLSILERMRLNPTRRLTNRSRGEHLSGKGGTSTEFSDYRNYVPGDDVRYIDWNIFSRLNKPFMKQYQHEEEMHVVLILDASSSMDYEDKFLRCKQLAAAFGVMGLLNFEKVSAYVCNQKGSRPEKFSPATGRISMKRLFDFLTQIEAGGNSPIELAVEDVLRTHRGRGVAIVLSDYESFGDLQRPFNMLYSAGLELFGVQILGPSEINPEINGDLRLIDSESGQTLDISSAGDLLGLYHEHRVLLEEHLAMLCRQRSGRFLTTNSGDSLEYVLFDLLRRKGWVL